MEIGIKAAIAPGGKKRHFALTITKRTTHATPTVQGAADARTPFLPRRQLATAIARPLFDYLSLSPGVSIRYWPWSHLLPVPGYLTFGLA